MQNALEISLKIWKNIHLKMTCQNAKVGTIILVSLIIGALVAFALYLDFKREELIFKREEWVFKREKLKMKDMTQNRRKQLEKKRRTKKLDLEAETQQSERKKQKKKKRR